MDGFTSFPEAKVISQLTCKTDPVERRGTFFNDCTLFVFYFLPGDFIPHPAGGDFRGEDHPEDGQDGDQRSVFR